jgi:multiple sugar transport system permease protein/raffinose/stachyose/melibiose transport system permease protein/trehalose/maltose transport system permease protein
MSTKTVATWIGLIIIAIIVLFPIIWAVRTSLAPTGTVELIPPEFKDNFTPLIERGIWVNIKNSLIVGLGTAGIVLCIALMGGYALGRFDFPGKRFGILLVVFPLLPPTALLIPLVTYIKTLGLINTLTSVIIVNVVFNLPFAVWTISTFITTIPKDLEEAAAIDGCTTAGIFFRIVLPLVSLGIITVTMFVFITAWNNYLYAYALTSSPELRVLPMAILDFIARYGTDYGGLCAAGTLSMIPPIILFVILQKYFVSGLTAGAVKG